MPENARFKRLARQEAARRGEPYTAAAERLRGELVYVPGYGFRPALAGFQSAAPVSEENAFGTATVTRVLGSADRVEVDVEVGSAADIPLHSATRGPVVHASLSDGARSADGSWLSLERDNRRARLRLTFPAMPGRVREVTLWLNGELGAWQVRIPVRPLGGVARRLDVGAGGSISRLGVTLAVTGVLFDRDRTVVRIAATAAEPIRFVRGLGTDLGSRRPPGRELVLVDDLGRSYPELIGGEERPDPAGRSHVVVFPPVDPDARRFRLDVPLVGVEERGDGVEVDVPVTPRVVSVGRYRMEVLSSEPARGSSGDFYPLCVHYRWLASPASRRPIGPGQVFVNGRGTAFGMPWSMVGAYVDVHVKDPPARSVRLAFPRVLLSARWRLGFTR